LRVGDYRVVFRQTAEVIRITRVRHRREVYR
jgi:mRNA-degrading endonuclease RelE of RelBE toxin-antitoxin system